MDYSTYKSPNSLDHLSLAETQLYLENVLEVTPSENY